MNHDALLIAGTIVLCLLYLTSKPESHENKNKTRD
jgi:hypothetical protein